MGEKDFYVYIMANKRNGALYAGVTSDLVKGVYRHKENWVEGFTQKYSAHQLVYYEYRNTAASVIKREKRVKKWRRQWKMALIEKAYPNWNDLYAQITGSRVKHGMTDE